ncbi:Heat shock protein 15 [invertebrate metagenome]|uniref:Heat shock protein 15 n=1 Tax=invertebrate metagenome TaxID=1711999 RepID=A0A2H9T6A2_9ZZZZ
MSSSQQSMKKTLSDKIRLDKWLWAARFYKTRALAKEAIDGGKVRLNDLPCKPGKEPKIGDIIRLRAGWDEKVVIVQALSDKRQKAELAQQLYTETPESIKLREAAIQARKTGSGMVPHPDRRPDKKQRRELRKIKPQ